jgi:serine/threonine protein phosphatase PrpC
MMGVADGHGSVGHLVSNFVKINLPKILANFIHKKPTNENNVAKVKKVTKSFLPSIGGKTIQDVSGSDSDHSGE